jgi:hypothetical protein
MRSFLESDNPNDQSLDQFPESHVQLEKKSVESLEPIKENFSELK